MTFTCAFHDPSSAQRSHFSILKGDEVIGSIAASRTEVADRTFYVMTSYSMLDVLWKREVRTSVMTEYVGGTVRSCRSSVHVDGRMRDSSNMVVEGEGHRCYVHPRRTFYRDQAPAWTTARMYFEEPVGQGSIFVESVLEACAIRNSGPGNYALTLPNGSQNRYVYKDGRLLEIQVDRAFLDLVFRRD